jgi:hypothetical protein
MVGRRSPKNPLISRLTLPPETIPSCYRRMRHTEFQPQSGRHADHSAFSRARNECFREGEVFRRIFERVVETCVAAGLVGGEGFAVDASLIAADANKQRSIAGKDWRRDRDPARSSRAVKEYLATLEDAAWGAATDVLPKFVSPSDPAGIVISLRVTSFPRAR